MKGNQELLPDLNPPMNAAVEDSTLQIQADWTVPCCTCPHDHI